MGQDPQRRPRRSPSDIRAIKDEMHAALKADHPMTVRQVFYRLVSDGRGLIEKTEGEYKRTVSRLLVEMRLQGDIPFDWIADNTRWMRKPEMHTGLKAMLEETAQFYRRDVWREQPAYIEVWLEKDALAGVLYEVTAPWGVPLMVTRGYASLSYLHEAAQAISENGKPAFLYYLGDYDPSGVDIERSVQARLREFAPDAEIHFQRVAVTPNQIKKWKLPSRPTKDADSRAGQFGPESVEVDAIASGQLRRLVDARIRRHVDQRLLEATERIEAAERETLAMIAGGVK